VNPTSPISWFRIVPIATQLSDDCDIRTHRYVDVFAQSIQGSGPMDPAVRARVHTCLHDAGVHASPDDRTDEEIFIRAGTTNIDNVIGCLRAAFRAEFPEREEITVGVPPEVGEG
jgi:hypothetical protein